MIGGIPACGPARSPPLLRLRRAEPENRPRMCRQPGDDDHPGFASAFLLGCGEKATATNDMHVHTLPWPVEFLRDLEPEQLRMRVTLSYFIEPNPGRRGWNRNHRYQSHGLRFDVKRPQESPTQFLQRLTRDAWDDDSPPGDAVKRHQSTGCSAMTFARKARSIPTFGTAPPPNWLHPASIAVYPITGWWRDKAEPAMLQQTCHVIH